jgi:hypothetical protein
LICYQDYFEYNNLRIGEIYFIDFSNSPEENLLNHHLEIEFLKKSMVWMDKIETKINFFEPDLPKLEIINT